MIREVKEETGLNVEVEHFIGVYSKYFHTYTNGDKSQSICHLFKCSMLNGELLVDNKETFDLKFFDKNNVPKLIIEQHTDMLNDFFENKIGVYK